MNIIQRILNPNKQYEDLFREIKADEILFLLTNNNSKLSVTISVANFYKFRELIIKIMSQKNPEIVKQLFKSRNIDDYTTGFGLYWFKSMMESTYSIKIRVYDEF